VKGAAFFANMVEGQLRRQIDVISRFLRAAGE
jgi:hypothetical protein